MIFMKKKELEILLEYVEPIEKPKVELEQYTIPSSLAAQILNLANLLGDISKKRVLDLGCGTGRLGIGASLLGAKLVVGVEIDREALARAKENLHKLEKLVGKKLKVFFVLCDVNNLAFKRKFDTVVQNPPFGCKGKRHADRIFLEKAIEFGKKIYS